MEKENLKEKAGRLHRDIHALGALALLGVAVVAPPVLATAATGLATYAGISAAGGEWFRRYSGKNRRKKAAK